MSNLSLYQTRMSDLVEEAGIEMADLVYLDPPFCTQRDFGEFDDRWSSLEEYVKIMISGISTFAPILKNGNLVVHVDPRSSHYLKVELDKVFGRKNFQNEIIWSYNSGGASKKRLSQKHDVLLWYGMGDFTFNVEREPYATPNVADRPGFHPDGRMLTDVWNIPFISTTSSERNGYPTQKPLALLERAVRVFTPEDGLVVDPCCGSGTAGEAAISLGRSFIGGDINSNALEITRARCGALGKED